MKRWIAWTLAGLSLWVAVAAVWAAVRPAGESALPKIELQADLQTLVSEKLAAHLERCGARQGMVVVMDPATGVVLSRAGFRRDEATGKMVVDEAGPFDVRFMGASTMKPLVVAGALEERVVKGSDLFDTSNGPLAIDGKTYNEWREGGLGKLTPADVLVTSSNLGAIQIAQRLGAERLAGFLERVGYGVGPGAPVADLSFGNYAGLSVSAYQLAYAYSILANGGYDPRTAEAVVRPDVSFYIRKALAEAVEKGTGTLAQCEGLAVGGKTGTSIREIEGRRTGTAYFVGFVPADVPRMVVSIIVDDVGSEVNGNRHAASLFPEIVTDGLPLVGKAAVAK
jgi:cell division protein FtsI (penicillin-binding protein 3)